jgi:hypothetical protein
MHGPNMLLGGHNVLRVDTTASAQVWTSLSGIGIVDIFGKVIVYE